MPKIKASVQLQRGSGEVASGSPIIIEFPKQTDLVTIAVKASTGNSIKVEFILDASAAVPLWIEWSHGDTDDSQVWSNAFEGGIHQFKITGDGNYSYAWD